MKVIKTSAFHVESFGLYRSLSNRYFNYFVSPGFFFPTIFSMTDLLIYQKCVSFNQLQSVQHLVSNWIMAMAFEDISTLSRTLWSSSECLRCYVCLCPCSFLLQLERFRANRRKDRKLSTGPTEGRGVLRRAQSTEGQCVHPINNQVNFE